VKKEPESFAASIFRSARSTIQDSIDASKEKIQESISDAAVDLRKEGRKLAKSTKTYVRKNPYSLMGAALVAGFVLGILLRRR
jgi:ElaB/YqjD/DUF883 family membrane-anchored ribosome-binding protein